jgi:nicotinamidase-related amidase
MSMAHDKFIASQQQLNAVPIKINLQTIALVIIDMQEYFLNPASPLCRFGEKRMPGQRAYFLEQGETVVIPNLRRLLEFFRTQHLRVIHTTAASELPDGQDWIPTLHQTNTVAREQVGEAVFPARTDPWARIVEPLTPRPEEVIINKTTYSAFTATSLDGLLRNLHIETLVLGESSRTGVWRRPLAMRPTGAIRPLCLPMRRRRTRRSRRRPRCSRSKARMATCGPPTRY